MHGCLCVREREAGNLGMIYLPSNEWASALAMLPLREHHKKGWSQYNEIFYVLNSDFLEKKKGGYLRHIPR